MARTAHDRRCCCGSCSIACGGGCLRRIARCWGSPACLCWITCRFPVADRRAGAAGGLSKARVSLAIQAFASLVSAATNRDEKEASAEAQFVAGRLRMLLSRLSRRARGAKEHLSRSRCGHAISTKQPTDFCSVIARPLGQRSRKAARRVRGGRTRWWLNVLLG